MNSLARSCLFVQVLLALTSTTSFAAPTPIVSLRAGEIELTGSVTSTDSSTHTIIIAADSVTLQGGSTTQFPASRAKTIVIKAGTVIDDSGGERNALACLRRGSLVTVIGRDGGVGQPMDARIVMATERRSAASGKARFEQANLDLKLIAAASEGDSRHLTALIAAGANPDAKDKFGNTALWYISDTDFSHLADKNRGERCIRILAAAGADMNERSVPRLNGTTALLTAATFGYVGYLKALIAAGADVNERVQGETALTWAARWGRADCLGPLIAAGADLNAKGGNGQTALALASYYGHTDSVSVLKAAGAK
jgi:uncharacterized protein